MPDFHPRAQELRNTFDERFADLRGDSQERFCWDYWHVPGEYTYVRTPARRYFPTGLYGDLMSALRRWGRDHLGCERLGDPWLSYYVNGCVQELHSDRVHGPWAYVLSLTRWQERPFEGGETVILRSRTLDFWRAFEPGKHMNHRDIVERIPAAFNQLLVFDPRIPHGVSRVEGCADPRRARLVIHGWFRPPVVSLEGALRMGEIADIPARLQQRVAAELGDPTRLMGLLVARLSIGADGTVSRVRCYSGALRSRDGGERISSDAVRRTEALLSTAEFPASTGTSELLLPVELPGPASAA